MHWIEMQVSWNHVHIFEVDNWKMTTIYLETLYTVNFSELESNIDHILNLQVLNVWE